MPAPVVAHVCIGGVMPKTRVVAGARVECQQGPISTQSSIATPTENYIATELSLITDIAIIRTPSVSSSVRYFWRAREIAAVAVIPFVSHVSMTWTWWDRGPVSLIHYCLMPFKWASQIIASGMYNF